MRTLIALGLIFAVSIAIASQSSANNILLENGYELHVKEIQPSRILPYAYYDQAMSSIPGVYPNSQIIAKRRFGYLRKDSSLFYSIICYKKIKDYDEVTISGVVTSKNKAWSFDAVVVESDFADTLLLVLENLSELSFNRQMRSDAADAAPLNLTLIGTFRINNRGFL